MPIPLLVLRLSLALPVALFALGAHASEWRIAGLTKMLNDNQSVLFFDAETVSHPTKDSVRFWLKGIQATQFDSYFKAHKRSVMDQTAKKLATGYAPDLFLLDPVRAQFANSKELNDAIDHYISWEIIANDPSVPTASKFYWEIDCAGRRVKTLDVALYNDRGELRPSGKLTNEYRSIDPDSNVQLWSLLLCPSK